MSPIRRLYGRGALVAMGVALVMVVGSCGADPNPPGVLAMVELCEQANDIAMSKLQPQNTGELLANEYYPGTDRHFVSCSTSPGYFVDVDDDTAAVDAQIAFHLAEDPGSVQEDYCETEGIISPPTDTSLKETRTFGEQPYCFYGGSREQVVSSYVDQGVVIAIYWRVSQYSGSLDDTADELGSRVLAANDAILQLIHDGFTSAANAMGN